MNGKPASGEQGQSIIFAAALTPLLLLTLGLAIEGGRLFTQYQRLRGVADVAALVGAQALPCDTTNTSCIAAAETKACHYATLNGAPSCTAGGSPGAGAYVPPLSCSPYDFIDFGNASSNSHCKNNASSTSTPYDYIEVQLSEPVQVPIFNVSFSLYTHAIAKRGEPSQRDFAVAVLDPHQDKALDFALVTKCLVRVVVLCPLTTTGAATVVGDAISDSDASDSISVQGDGTGVQVTCSGRWFTYATESAPSGLNTEIGGSASIAPPRCSSASGYDNPPEFIDNYPRQDDPYASSSTPTGNMSSNCAVCAGEGWAYHWSSLLGRAHGSWVEAGDLSSSISSDNWEFFPGTYPNGIDLASGVGNIYFDPGVYTMEGNLTIQSGTVCIYGAPACDETTSNAIPGVTGVKCWNASFDALDAVYVLSSIWYHFCSPYGSWDASQLTGRPSTLSTAPTFTDGTLMNGVTFYMASGTFDMETSSAAYLAAPNPCPGTGQDTLLPIASDDFPAGSSSATSTYIYPPTSLAGQDAVLWGGLLSGSLTSTPGQLYPNVDYSVSEDSACNTRSSGTAADEWTGEFPSGVTSHLHFLVFQRDSSHGITLESSAQQYWWGILYNPGNYDSGGGCASACEVHIGSLQVSSLPGSGVTTCSVFGLTLTCGPPTVLGQVVADNLTIDGSVAVEIYYRQYSPLESGPGTSLIE